MSALVNNFHKRKRREAAYEFGQRVYIKYGNGVETTYDYKKETRLLEGIETQSSYGQKYQNIKYRFDKVGNILGYTNDCLNNGVSGNYVTSQSYTYDGLNQLLSVHGDTEFRNNNSGYPSFTSSYEQHFEFDIIGNMTLKTSKDVTLYGDRKGDDLNYELNYKPEKGFAHRYSQIGSRYYRYDEAGNITEEREAPFEQVDEGDYYKVEEIEEDVYGVNEAWGYFSDAGPEGSANRYDAKIYHRKFTWDEKNQLIRSTDNTFDVYFVYGEDGKRSHKYTWDTETLYFNNFWSYYKDGTTSFAGGKVSKHIFLGETRLATTINDYAYAVNGDHSTESDHIYYYHSDHLGSAQLVTDYRGDEYERLEYTPYGETWVNVKIQGDNERTPMSFRFSAKELDKETGFYYYGARYLDPKYSHWMSTDPALGKYTSKDYKGTSGGIYNSINLNIYNYGNNNPIKYTDPDGNETYDSSITNEEFSKIQYKLPPLSESSNSPFNNPSWDDVQNFFAQNPNGCISRNPDEASYRFYTNEGKDKPVEYNMITGDELMLLGLGKAIGKGIFKLGKIGVSSWGNLQYAGKHGILTYSNLKRAIAGKGLEAHHIIEKRFLPALQKIKNLTAGKMKSVALTHAEHQVFTNRWRDFFEYGKTNYKGLSPTQIWKAAKKIYKDYPELLDAAKKTLFGE